MTENSNSIIKVCKYIIYKYFVSISRILKF